MLKAQAEADGYDSDSRQKKGDRSNQDDKESQD